MAVSGSAASAIVAWSSGVLSSSSSSSSSLIVVGVVVDEDVEPVGSVADGSTGSSTAGCSVVVITRTCSSWPSNGFTVPAFDTSVEDDEESVDEIDVLRFLTSTLAVG